MAKAKGGNAADAEILETGPRVGTGRVSADPVASAGAGREVREVPAGNVPGATGVKAAAETAAGREDGANAVARAGRRKIVLRSSCPNWRSLSFPKKKGLNHSRAKSN